MDVGGIICAIRPPTHYPYQHLACWLEGRVVFALISPTHKRAEGRAPVWGSEFTSKETALQGGIQKKTAARLNVKLWVLVVTDWWNLTAYSRPVF
jgi:hypothetical protein